MIQPVAGTAFPGSPNPDGLIGLPIRALGIDRSGVFPKSRSTRAAMGAECSNGRTFPPRGGAVDVDKLRADGIRGLAVGVGVRGGSKATFAGARRRWRRHEHPRQRRASGKTRQKRPRPCSSIATDPTNASMVYAATGRGVIKSIDGGDSWAPASGTGVTALPLVCNITDPFRPGGLPPQAGPQRPEPAAAGARDHRGPGRSSHALRRRGGTVPQRGRRR